jgi:cytochrome P450
MVALQYNPFVPENHANPYPLYRQLREQDPVHRNELLDSWFLTRYDDVVAVLKHPRFSADRRQARSSLVQSALRAQSQAGPFSQAQTMLSSDPPEHTRLRGLASKAFTFKAVEALRPRIQQIVAELLDAVEAKGTFDVIWDLGYPLPVIVIAEMLGVPPEQRDTFKHWSDNIVANLGPTGGVEETRLRGLESAMEMAAYFRDVIAERRRVPKDDLVSALVAEEERGDALSEEEVIATCILLLAAGNETTTNLIGNGMLALLRNPDQLELLRAQPELTDSAVEELLRYDGPVQTTARVALEDIEIGGRTIEEGKIAFCMLAAANRDPAQFANPEVLSVTRSENRHIAFGFGLHFCLGAPLARAEAQIAFPALLKRFPKLALETEPEWGGSFILRGLKSLPVSIT